MKIIDRAQSFVEKLQKSLDEGIITEEEWYEKNNKHFTKMYLNSDNPRAQSGHSGDENHYFYSQVIILEAINKSGTLIDVGCANGYLIKSLKKWMKGFNFDIEFYGLDISVDLIDLAKKRMPNLKDRLYIGNAIDWKPENKYDFVCVKALGYVPNKRRNKFFNHLINNYLQNNGRLILGPYWIEKDNDELEKEIKEWGYIPSGYAEKTHPTHKKLVRKLLWFDRE